MTGYTICVGTIYYLYVLMFLLQSDVLGTNIHFYVDTFIKLTVGVESNKMINL